MALCCGGLACALCDVQRVCGLYLPGTHPHVVTLENVTRHFSLFPGGSRMVCRLRTTAIKGCPQTRSVLLQNSRCRILSPNTKECSLIEGQSERGTCMGRIHGWIMGSVSHGIASPNNCRQTSAFTLFKKPVYSHHPTDRKAVSQLFGGYKARIPEAPPSTASLC